MKKSLLSVGLFVISVNLSGMQISVFQSDNRANNSEKSVTISYADKAKADISSNESKVEYVKRLAEPKKKECLNDDMVTGSVVDEWRTSEIERLIRKDPLLVKGRDKKGNTPLHVALNNYLTILANDLISDPGVDVNAQNSDGITPFLLALKIYRRIRSLDLRRTYQSLLTCFCLRGDLDVNIVANDKSSPLTEAVLIGNWDILWKLIRKGVDKKTLNYQQVHQFNNPFALQSFEQGHEIFEALKQGLHWKAWDILDKIDNPFLKNESNTLYRCVQLFGRALSDLALINSYDERGDTALTIACAFGLEKMAEKLLREGINPNKPGEFSGVTPLIMACKNNNLKLVDLLLRYKADVNQVNERGASALIEASKWGHFDIVDLLLKNGADFHYKNDNKTPYDYAKSFQHEKIAKLIESYQEENSNQEEQPDVFSFCYDRKFNWGNDVEDETFSSDKIFANGQSNKEDIVENTADKLLNKEDNIENKIIQSDGESLNGGKNSLNNENHASIDNKEKESPKDLFPHKDIVQEKYLLGQLEYPNQQINSMNDQLKKRSENTFISETLDIDHDFFNHYRRNSMPGGLWSLENIENQQSAYFRSIEFNPSNLLLLDGVIELPKEDDKKISKLQQDQNSGEKTKQLLRCDNKEDNKNIDSSKLADTLALKESSLLSKHTKEPDKITEIKQETIDPQQIQFRENIKTLSIEWIKQRVDEGLINDAIDESGNTLLHVAVTNNNIEIIKLLLKNNADLNIKNEAGNTALHNAVMQEDLSIVNLLLKHKAKLNLRNQRGMSPLMLAANAGNIKILKTLIKHGSQVNAINYDKNNALMISLLSDNCDLSTKHNISVILLNADLSIINQVNNNEETAESIAESRKFENIKQLVREARKELNRINRQKKTEQKESNKINGPKEEKQADNTKNSTIELINNQKKGIEMFVDLKSFRTMLETLIGGYKKFFDTAKSGNLPMQRAKKKEEAKIRDTEAKIRDTVEDAILSNDYKLIAELIEGDKKLLNTPIDEKGNTPLLLVLTRNCLNALDKIMNYDDDIDFTYQNKDGKTAFIVAVENKNIDIISMFIDQRRPGVNIADKEGNTPLILMIKSDECFIADIVICYLLKCYPDIEINHQNNNKETALIAALKQKRLEIALLLLENPNLRLNMTDEEGNTQLSLAMEVFQEALEIQYSENKDDLIKISLNVLSELRQRDVKKANQLIVANFHNLITKRKFDVKILNSFRNALLTRP